MPKLHEVLAVEGDLEGQYKKIIEEATTVFKKGEHFIGGTKTLTMFDEGRKHEEEAGYEHRALTTTVKDKLKYASTSIIRYLDAVAQKESTNQLAKADVELNGAVILAEVPATLLLGLETKLKTIRGMYEAIPTLGPGIEWKRDETQGPDVWVMAEPETAMKTEKVIKPFVMYEATKEHPAQVKELSDTVNVGIYKRRHVSGALSPKEKSELLGRVDNLIRAVKKARQRANMQEVAKKDIGKILMDYINSGPASAE